MHPACRRPQPAWPRPQRRSVLRDRRSAVLVRLRRPSRRASGRSSASTQRPATHCLRSLTLRPSTTRCGVNCIVAASGLRQHCACRRETVDIGAFRGSTISTLSSSIERVEPTSNASNSRCTASKTTDGTVRIDQPVAVLEGQRSSPLRPTECRGIDSGIADPGAAELHVARKQRQRPDAEFDRLGLEHRRTVRASSSG